jgi:hypothetical protein
MSASQSRPQTESCPWPPVGNRVDPQASADDMKARFAEMEQEAPATINRISWEATP